MSHFNTWTRGQPKHLNMFLKSLRLNSPWVHQMTILLASPHLIPPTSALRSLQSLPPAVDSRPSPDQAPRSLIIRLSLSPHILIGFVLFSPVWSSSSSCVFVPLLPSAVVSCFRRILFPGLPWLWAFVCPPETHWTLPACLPARLWPWQSGPIPGVPAALRAPVVTGSQLSTSQHVSLYYVMLLKKTTFKKAI